MDWQPIATAPKDGTEIAVWNKCYRFIPIARWRENTGVSESGEDTVFFGWHLRDELSSPCCSADDGFIGWDEDIEDGYMPTHWMPLPAPPAPTQETPNE